MCDHIPAQRSLDDKLLERTQWSAQGQGGCLHLFATELLQCLHAQLMPSKATINLIGIGKWPRTVVDFTPTPGRPCARCVP